jgi:hypothetical protein
LNIKKVSDIEQHYKWLGGNNMIEQACQKIPNVVTEQIIIDEKYRTRLLPVTA